MSNISNPPTFSPTERAPLSKSTQSSKTPKLPNRNSVKTPSKKVLVIVLVAVLAIIAFVAYSFLSPTEKETATPAKTPTVKASASILQALAPELTNGVDCQYFSQPVGFIADEKYCPALLAAIQTVNIEGVSNTDVVATPTVCELRSVVIGVVREPYLCDVLLTVVTGSPVEDGVVVAPVVTPEVAVEPTLPSGVDVEDVSLTLETRPITGGGVACVYVNDDTNKEYTNYEVESADDCVPADELLNG